ncbi:MAG: hypothetical protein P4L33_19195 [Capsulimonadaceae bacterium]|nr:hypothetical protein [Capsulimonadaceae bacterium]
MNKIQFDKKQLPQVIVLGLLALCLFGYATSKLLTPPPIEAAKPAAKPAQPAPSDNVTASASLTQVSLLDAPPAANARDPFAGQSVADAPKPIANGTVRPAPIKPAPSLPSLNALEPLGTPRIQLPPGFKSVSAPMTAPRPVAEAPAWSYAGLITSDGDPGNQIAVLRKGDERRFVRIGEEIEPDVRIVAIQSALVVLKSGGRRYLIKLGAAAKSISAPAAPQDAPQAPDASLAPASSIHPPGANTQAPVM